ncbi:MAG: DeoR/GlpR family DNA-binding transcription regulator [Lachnospiraceae bacterium]|nr:DeoR/GlpR family DNA-binding transcription regulator [Lachnospiraceae bacterium]
MRTKRIDQIETYVLENKTVTLDKLCKNFNVSKNTIRRDIDQLITRGKITKVYGGVTAISKQDSNFRTIIPFAKRNSTLEKEKDAICREAASFIHDGDTIYIDTGTTSQNLVDYIANKHCTIITNSLQVSVKAVPYPNLNVISLTGTLKRDTLSFVGSQIMHELETYNINKAFLCCTGLSLNNGLTNATTDEYEIKKSVIKNSQTRILLADHSKFDKFTLMTFSPISSMQYIVTDREPEEKYMRHLKEHGVVLQLAT